MRSAVYLAEEALAVSCERESVDESGVCLVCNLHLLELYGGVPFLIHIIKELT